jgi:hypothetical protein
MKRADFLNQIRKDHKLKYDMAYIIDQILGVNNSMCTLYYESMTKAELKERFENVLTNHTDKAIKICLGWNIYKDIEIEEEVKQVEGYQALNFDKLMNLKPTMYGTVTNQDGQEVEFYEHPIKGDEYPVIAVFKDKKIAVCTDFYDTEDFFNGSDYNPVIRNNKVVPFFYTY